MPPRPNKHGMSLPLVVWPRSVPASRGQQFQRRDVTRAHDLEMPMIERRELGFAQPFGEREHRGVD